jgi:NADH:ubiquinone oxidoreductase subunit E
MQHIRAHVLVCGGTGCKANGSKEIQLTFAEIFTEVHFEKLS